MAAHIAELYSQGEAHVVELVRRREPFLRRFIAKEALARPPKEGSPLEGLVRAYAEEVEEKAAAAAAEQKRRKTE